jgi:DNA helicase-2/ATP-dependent DNA helicase PcrA
VGREGSPVYTSDLLAELNHQQQKAVTHLGGPILVLAGAGSGKTRVIAYRVAYLLKALNVPPERILAVTFTNKAAGEMRERLSVMPGEGAGDIWIHTFHRTCSRILRRKGPLIGLQPGFTVADYQDQISLVRRIIKEDVPHPPEGITPDTVLTWIGRLKDELIGPEEFHPGDPEESFLAQVYRHYQSCLRKDNLLDFDDLLLETIRLFQEAPGALEEYRERFGHLLVDEFQDTNTAQYRIMTMMAGEGRGLCVVGDEDQSIYRWRGAAPENFRRLREDYPELKTFVLERNYRSTPIILRAAAQLIDRNLGRTPKKLSAHRKGGDQVTYFLAGDEEAEADWVVRRIGGLSLSRYRTEEMAVLYRINTQSRPMEVALSAAGIPYKLVGGTRFFLRQEVKDLLAYMRLSINPDDDTSFRRVVNRPSRGIGPVTLDFLEKEAGLSGDSLFKTAAGAAQSPSGPGKRIGPFSELVGKLAEATPGLSPEDLLDEILRSSGYGEWLESDPARAGGRTASVASLSGFLRNLPPPAEGEDRLTAFLDEVSLLTDADESDDRPGVSLMTLHSAKGLEFPVVFLVGLEEGLLPHSRALTDQEELEEERRLMYVGMTRARDKLFLSATRSRVLYGRTIWPAPSRFLDDLKPSTLKEEEGGLPDSFKGPAGPDDYPLGGKVRHPRFGIGTILGREGAGEDLKLSIHFQGLGRKKLLARSAGLLSL